MRVEPETIAAVVRQARTSSHLSKVDFARAAATTRAAVDEYEKGLRVPRVDSLLNMLKPAGLQLRVHTQLGTTSDVGATLATFATTVDPEDPKWAWRSLISDFVANEFAPALGPERAALLTDEPIKTGSQGWDSFIGALAEHLSFHARIDPPRWVFDPHRGALDQYWWPVHGELPSMRAAALVLAPAAFRRRCIAIDGREVPVIVP